MTPAPLWDAHPGKRHIYNARGYCWCGVHRDDGLADAICEVLQKREQPAGVPPKEPAGDK